MKRIILNGAAAAVVAAASGCLVVGSKTMEESGVHVSGSTLAEVRPGETTEAWLVATLGEPTAVTVVPGEENVRVLRYEHCVRKSEGGAVFLLFAGETEKTTKRTVFFETVDGIVNRYWAEP